MKSQSTMVPEDRDGEENNEEDGDALGVMFVKWKQKVRLWLGHEPPKSEDEMKMNEMADIIRTYRGVLEEEEEDNKEILWVDSWKFDVLMSTIIVLNTIAIGLEVEFVHDNDERAWYWFVIELAFCATFLGEIVVKVSHHTWRWIFAEVWNFVAVLVAIMATLDAFILHPLGIYGNLRMMSLFRVVGLVRLAKLVRRFKALEELRQVMAGLTDSIQTVIWTVILVTIFIYISAVLLTKQIGHNTEVYASYRKLSGGWDHEEYFGTVGRSMYTLLQAMTLDSWMSRIARHTIENQWYMVVFWIVFLLISTFGILNIVVSVIVELMLTASANNEKALRVRQEKARKAELETLRDIFLLSDEDGGGELELSELQDAMKNPDVQFRMRQLDLPMDDIVKLFEAIDDDGSRSLTFTEFINGAMKLKGPAQSKELLAVQAHADRLARKMDVLAESLADSERMMDALDEVTSRICRRFDSALLGSRRKIAQSVGGSAPVKPVPREGTIGNYVPLSTGNRPALPQFPDLLR